MSTPAYNSSSAKFQTPLDNAPSAVAVANDGNNHNNTTSLKPSNLDQTKFGKVRQNHPEPSPKGVRKRDKVTHNVLIEGDKVDELDLDTEDLVDQDKNARFVKGQVTRDCVSIARSTVTYISQIIKQEIIIVVDGKRVVIPAGKDFRTTDSPDDIKILLSMAPSLLL